MQLSFYFAIALAKTIITLEEEIYDIVIDYA